MERKSQPSMHKQKDYFFLIDKIGIVIFSLFLKQVAGLNASTQRALLLQRHIRALEFWKKADCSKCIFFVQVLVLLSPRQVMRN